MADDRGYLSELAKRLEPLCAHVSVRDDNTVPYLFAVGLRHFHSLELMRKDNELKLELWRGHQGSDTVTSVETPTSFADAALLCERWLENDLTGGT